VNLHVPAGKKAYLPSDFMPTLAALKRDADPVLMQDANQQSALLDAELFGVEP